MKSALCYINFVLLIMPDFEFDMVRKTLQQIIYIHTNSVIFFEEHIYMGSKHWKYLFIGILEGYRKSVWNEQKEYINK